MTKKQDDAFDEEVISPDSEGRGVTIDDFVAFMPTHAYIFTPCREFWVSTSVNSATAAGTGARSPRQTKTRCQRQAP